MENTKTGTTTLGVVCKDGVVVAADQQATLGYIVSAKEVKKIFRIADRICLTLAGDVGDAQALVRLLQAELKLYQLEEKELTVKAAGTLISNILRSAYKSFRPELVQLLLAGHDSRGPSLYSLGPAGSLIEDKAYAFTGSGSVIAVGVLEDKYKKDMSIDEGVNLVVRSIRAARERDIATGGKRLNIMIVTSKGVEELSADKVDELLAAKK